MSLRIKRLFNEYQEISDTFKSHPNILIKDVFGNPPEKYLIEYKIAGLVQENNNLIKKDTHLVEIILPSEYPSTEPVCRMQSPAFHPNIDSNKICIADYWAAGESLADVIIRIGEIISYQNYNIKSPLNGEAAKWAGQNMHKFPIDTADLFVQKENEQKEHIADEYIQEKREIIRQECSNCGALSSDVSYNECINGHTTCPDCTAECQKCGKAVCVLCPMNKCLICGKVFCDNCKIVCPLCGNTVCEEHLGECCVCQCGAKGKDIKFTKCAYGHLACPDCVIECEDCGKTLCVSCDFSKCSTCGKILCSDCSSICPSCGKVTCGIHQDCSEHSDQVNENKIKVTSENFSANLTLGNSELEKGITCNKCGHTTSSLTASFCEMCGHKFQ